MLVNGGNFGWDEREGSFQLEGPKPAGAIDPVAEFDHTNTAPNLTGVTGNRAITMGEVVRESTILDLNGNVILGDNPSGLIFYLNADTDPLDGGQNGILELNTIDATSAQVRLLDLINDERASLGLGSVDRADLRFSQGTAGEVYVLNKQDGVIRVLVPEPGSALLLAGAMVLLSRRTRGGAAGLSHAN